MIQGEVREFKEFKKYVGVGEFNILGFNFDRATIVKECGYDPGVDPVYVKPMMVRVDGNDRQVNTSNVSVFMKSATAPDLFMRLSFLLKETDDVSSKGNVKYVNTKCASTYVLAEWFTKYEHRKAFVAECDFLHFMRMWLSNFRWEGSATYPLKETLPLFKGNFNALNDLARRYPKQTIGVLCGIRDTEKGSKQDTCNRAFLPGYAVSTIQGMKTGLDPENLSIDNKSVKNVIRNFIKVVEGQYGYKNFFGNDYTFREYDPKTNVVAGTSSVIVNKDDIQF